MTLHTALMAAVCAVVCCSAGVRASISGNPDSWELPPAAPNYLYLAQGILGTGSLATLVVARDPNSANTAYNTSLFAFSVSGGLVPLNYLDLTDGHCRTTFVADLLVCDFQSSGSGYTILYQLAVNPGAGGANRMVIIDQVTVPTVGGLANNAVPVYVPATGHVLALQYQTDTKYVVYDIARNTSAGTALSVTAVGTVDVSGVVFSIAVNADGTELTLSDDRGLTTYSYPALQQVNQVNPLKHSAYEFPIANAATTDFGFVLYMVKPSQGLSYQAIDLTDGSLIGSAFVDPTSSFMSSGAWVTTSGSTFAGAMGPCVYVQAYANQQKSGQYALISQVRVPTNSGAGFTIEAQLPLAGPVGATMVANSGYLFTIYQEIMYRYIASC